MRVAGSESLLGAKLPSFPTQYQSVIPFSVPSCACVRWWNPEPSANDPQPRPKCARRVALLHMVQVCPSKRRWTRSCRHRTRVPEWESEGKNPKFAHNHLRCSQQGIGKYMKKYHRSSRVGFTSTHLFGCQKGSKGRRFGTTGPHASNDSHKRPMPDTTWLRCFG